MDDRQLYILITKIDKMKTEVDEMVTSVEASDYSAQSEWAISKLRDVKSALSVARNALYAIEITS